VFRKARVNPHLFRYVEERSARGSTLGFRLWGREGRSKGATSTSFLEVIEGSLDKPEKKKHHFEAERGGRQVFPEGEGKIDCGL